MYHKLLNYTAAHLVKKGIHEDDAIHQYLISFIATLFCLFAHLYFLVVFIATRSLPFICINTVSIACYAVALFLHRKRRFTATTLVATAEVTIYATLFTMLDGVSTYIIGYYLLVAVLQVVLPYSTLRRRTGVLVGIFVIASCSLILGLVNMPSAGFSPGLHTLLLVSNIYLLFIGTVVQLYIGNVVRRIIERSNDLKMLELSALANTDPLTGLYNRRYADSHIARLAKENSPQPYCVAMLDIDDFKLVNDTWGHPVGDEVLVWLAGFLRERLRKSDEIFRWGGEEILVVLENVTSPTAHSILDKLRQQLEESTIETEAGPLKITVTIGVAPLDPTAPASSIRYCDEQLYLGKQQGKNRVVSI
ncbi:MAG: GGDEF domain-containing protein [Ruminococcaceae bacterium]|nr:GGDEF domain-containing protein [Oscillospiraceae bacterium]